MADWVTDVVTRSSLKDEGAKRIVARLATRYAARKRLNEWEEVVLLFCTTSHKAIFREQSNVAYTLSRSNVFRDDDDTLFDLFDNYLRVINELHDWTKTMLEFVADSVDGIVHLFELPGRGVVAVGKRAPENPDGSSSSSSSSESEPRFGEPEPSATGAAQAGFEIGSDLELTDDGGWKNWPKEDSEDDDGVFPN